MEVLRKANKIVAGLIKEGMFSLANEFLEAVTPEEVVESAKKVPWKGKKRKKYKRRKPGQQHLKTRNPKAWKTWRKWYKANKKRLHALMRKYYKQNKSKWKKYAKNRKKG